MKLQSITYITLFYNKNEFESMLLDSMHKYSGGVNKNLIIIDNSDRKFKSCATAYNTTLEFRIDEVNDIIVFIHPDMAFDSLDFEKRILEELNANSNQILGFAGETTTYTLSNLQYRQTKEFIAIPFQEKTECLCIDECCFAMTKDLYYKIKFDEVNCDNWHLYAVDICYEARRRFGTKTYVLPEPMYHKENAGGGLTADNHFLKAMWRLTIKYRNDYAEIKTTCYRCPTKGLYRLFHLGCSWLHNVRHKFMIMLK